MGRINCEHCNALVTPGASFCLACFMPFDDVPTPATEAPAAPQPPYGGTPGYGGAPGGAPGYGATPGYGTAPGYGGGAPGYGGGAPGYGTPAPYGAPVPAGVGAAAGGGNDFFAAPPPQPQFQHHPGQGVDWRVNAPQAALLSQRKPPSKAPKIILAVVGVVVLLGGFLLAKAIFTRPSEKQEFATAFREARPPDFFPAFPDLGSFAGGLDEGVEAPGAAQAYVRSIDAKVRAGNDAILAMQQTMDRWADGKVTDDQLRQEIKAFDKTLAKAASTDMVFEAPESTRRGVSKLAESVTDYRLAMNALLDWLDSRSGGARITFRLSIGTANVHWDEGLINLYRAGELPMPKLPHPQPKK